MIARTLTAAATRFTRKLTGRTGGNTSTNSGWQEQAWGFYDTVPEVQFIANWLGNTAGAARLFAGRRLEDGSIEPAPDDHPAARIVSEIAGGPDGQAQLLAESVVHLVVAGEFWFVVAPNEAGDADWHVLSVSEVSKNRDGLTVEIMGEKHEVPAGDPDQFADADTPVAIRVWKAYPRRHIEADSPIRSSLVVLEELQLLNAAVAAIARSRITGRGVLVVPKGARFPTAPGQGDAEDDLLEVFMEVAATAIREPESAAATVPIIFEVPAELAGKVEWLTFESAFDELALKLRDEALRRFATGMDVPAEVILGLSAANHWTAWKLGSDAVESGVDPRLRIICEAFTTHWLQPLLEAEPVDDPGEWLVWFDTSSIKSQGSRAQTALEAFQLKLISAESARREIGFDESDAPDSAAPPVTPGAAPELPVGESPGTPTTDTAPPAGQQGATP